MDRRIAGGRKVVDRLARGLGQGGRYVRAANEGLVIDPRYVFDLATVGRTIGTPPHPVRATQPAQGPDPGGPEGGRSNDEDDVVGGSPKGQGYACRGVAPPEGPEPPRTEHVDGLDFTTEAFEGPEAE